MGRHPVAVVILHITYAQTMRVDYSRFSWGGLHGKHVVATWKGKTATIPAYAVGPRKKQEKPVSSFPVAGPSGWLFLLRLVMHGTNIKFLICFFNISLYVLFFSMSLTYKLMLRQTEAFSLCACDSRLSVWAGSLIKRSVD
jgi:hypothetical protein